MTTYTAITIGPIYRTIMKARSTKAFWTASYMFSWIMKRLIEGLPKEKIISPCATSSETIKKVGLYPDRLFLEGIVDVDVIIDKIMDDLTSKFCNLPKTPWKEESVKAFLKNYINISPIKVELDSEEDLLMKLNKYLDTQELRQVAVSTSSNDYLTKFLEAKDNPFVEYHFGKGERAFKSISEIAISGWMSELPPVDANNEVLYSELSGKEDYHNCYKYMAIVKADGDNFVKYLSELRSVKDMKDFSDRFFSFSKEVAEKLDGMKAKPIYIGGDDLFFFAPVRMTSPDKDVFDLIEIVDQTFQAFRKQLGENSLSMSYGVSIFYYKNPMSEAMAVADDMLKMAKDTPHKDRVAVSIQKHSGQKIEFLLPCKHTAGTAASEQKTLYNAARDLMIHTISNATMINGLIYWIDEMYEPIISKVAGDQERLKAVFENFFDEDVHKDNHFLNQVREFIAQMNASEEVPEMMAQKKLLHGILRYCQFVNAKEEK